MSLLAIVRKVWKYRLLMAPLFALVLAGSYYVLAVKGPTYESGATYILVSPPPPPLQQIGRDTADNPYLRYTSQTVLVQVLASRLTSDDTRAALARKGADANYSVASSPEFGMNAPMLQVMGTGATAAGAIRTANLVGAAITDELALMQHVRRVDDRYRIRAEAVVAAHDAALKGSGKTRVLLAVLVLGTILMFVLMSTADAFTALGTERVKRRRQSTEGEVAVAGAPVAGPPRPAERVHWLDGVRGVAATFVVVHHMWSAVWPTTQPVNLGPWWLGWLLYGHMAVATFIVVSGFSLALAPLRDGGRLSGGIRRFLRRRAWRILPAYLAALVLSIAITALLLEPDLSPAQIARTFGVYGLLLQDAVGSPNPNFALWSIAVEWQIYFVFPLILLIGRRTSIVTAAASTFLVVILAHQAAAMGGVLDKIYGLTPQFLALFTLGVLAVWLGRRATATSMRGPLLATAILGLGGFVVLAATQGSEWVAARFFWMDLLFGTGIAAVFTLMYSGALGSLRRVLSSRPLMWLGLFSYSLYLIHEPLTRVFQKYIFGPLDLSPVATYGVSLALGLPAILALAYGFHLVFEAPFLHQRGLSALRSMPFVRRAPKRQPLEIGAKEMPPLGRSWPRRAES
jgi:peptidoglycan/LPS O-acetylase OafA/YrhL